MKTETLESTHIIGSIKDTKSEIYFAPHLFRSKADFIRSIQSEAKNPQSMLNKFPSDYELYCLGSWCEYTGISTTSTDRIGSVLDLCPLN